MDNFDSDLSSASSEGASEASSSRKSSRSGDSFHAPRDSGGPHETSFIGQGEEPARGSSLGVSVHTGFPNPAADKRLRSLDINQLLIKQPNSTFIFRIRGHEGTAQGIFDGDLAVVDRATNPRPSDFVLWHDGTNFKLSRPSRMTEGAVQWGVITSVIHQYR